MYEKSVPSRTSIRFWVAQYHSDGNHSHSGDIGRPQIRDEQRAAV